MDPDLPLRLTHEVRDHCLCLRAQRAARALARRFDEAFRPLALTNGQFSLLTALNRPDPPRIVDLSPLLAMDRSTLTAALKPLEQRGWVESLADPDDRRARRVRLTDAGRDLLRRALPVWRAVHAELDDTLGAAAQRLRRDLGRLA